MASLAARALLAVAVAPSGEGQGTGCLLSDLVEAARGGSAEAFDQLMVATQRRVLSVCWRLLGNREDARDAAQEVFLRVYRHLGRFRAGEDFHAWIYRIAVNVCRDHARRRRRLPLAAVEATEPAILSRVEEELLRAERRETVLAALAALPAGERAAIVLRDIEGLTSPQVASILGSRPGTIRAQISSARLKIRDHCALLLGRRKGVGP